MALEQLHLLPPIAPVRDELWYQVRCGGWHTTEPVRDQYTLVLTDEPAPGTGFRLIIEGIAVEFLWTIEPDQSGTQILLMGYPDDTQGYLTQALRANWLVSQHFEVTEAGGTTTLVARRNGAVHVVFDHIGTPAHTWTHTVEGNDEGVTPNYNAALQVWVEEQWMSGIYTALPPMVCLPDANGMASWNLRGMLLPHVNEGYAWPGMATPLAVKCPGLLRRYRVDRYEMLGDPPVPQRLDPVPGPLVGDVPQPFVAWFAGSRNAEETRILDFFAAIANTSAPSPWLTWRGLAGRHEVTPTQQHYLSYYRNRPREDEVPVVLNILVTYHDGTTAAHTMPVDNHIAWNLGEVVTIPVGYTTLDELPPLEAGRTPVRYRVHLTLGGTIISQYHDFHLVLPDANDLYIEYVNSLGVVESLRGSGSWELGIEGQHTAIIRERARASGYLTQPERGATSHHQHSLRRTIKWTSGLMEYGEFNTCLDVLFSPEHRQVDMARSRRHQLLLVGGSHVVHVQGDPAQENLHALNLEFVLGDTEHAWSDVMHLP